MGVSKPSLRLMILCTDFVENCNYINNLAAFLKCIPKVFFNNFCIKVSLTKCAVISGYLKHGWLLRPTTEKNISHPCIYCVERIDVIHRVWFNCVNNPNTVEPGQILKHFVLRFQLTPVYGK